jgi:hypothetical protein
VEERRFSAAFCGTLSMRADAHSHFSRKTRP